MTKMSTHAPEERTHQTVAAEFMAYVRNLPVAENNIYQAINVAHGREPLRVPGNVFQQMRDEMMENALKAIEEGHANTVNYRSIENSLHNRMMQWIDAKNRREREEEEHLRAEADALRRQEEEEARLERMREGHGVDTKRKRELYDDDDYDDEEEEEEPLTKDQRRARHNFVERVTGNVYFFDEDEDENTPRYMRGAQRDPPSNHIPSYI
jgi:hypothetical protein